VTFQDSESNMEYSFGNEKCLAKKKDKPLLPPESEILHLNVDLHLQRMKCDRLIIENEKKYGDIKRTTDTLQNQFDSAKTASDTLLADITFHQEKYKQLEKRFKALQKTFQKCHQNLETVFAAKQLQSETRDLISYSKQQNKNVSRLHRTLEKGNDVRVPVTRLTRGPRSPRPRAPINAVPIRSKLTVKQVCWS